MNLLTNYKIVFSYDGTHFLGSQKQKNLRTVSSEFEFALNTIFKDIEKIIFSGRTDTGVHANEQVLNFKSSLTIATDKLKYALNNVLPKDIFITEVFHVDEHFNSRFSVKSRQYQYIFTTDELPVYLKSYVSHYSLNVDNILITKYLSLINGQHYFDIFRKIGSAEKTTLRNVIKTNFFSEQYKVLTDSEKHIRLYKIEITANSFLYRMVRNVVGCLFEILNNKITLEEFEEAFKNRQKQFNFASASPQGLYLNKIEY